MWNRFGLQALVCVALLCGSIMAAAAQGRPAVSKCLAMTHRGSDFLNVSFQPAALAKDQLKLSYLGHSTFLLTSPRKVRIATDFTGFYGNEGLPTVVTMNHAHTSHYTDNPDPGIQHVLRGWNPKGGYAQHQLQVKDVHIRSVPTNIRTWSGGTEQWGNSIFIFEVANMCIAHLGHLHHELTLQQLGQIGQLDIVMVPVDGAVTMDHGGMIKVLKKLKPRLIIPMHFFYSGSLESFMTRMSTEFAVRKHDSPTIVLSQSTLPDKITVMSMPNF